MLQTFFDISCGSTYDFKCLICKKKDDEPLLNSKVNNKSVYSHQTSEKYKIIFFIEKMWKKFLLDEIVSARFWTYLCKGFEHFRSKMLAKLFSELLQNNPPLKKRLTNAEFIQQTKRDFVFAIVFKYVWESIKKDQNL